MDIDIIRLYPPSI